MPERAAAWRRVWLWDTRALDYVLSTKAITELKRTTFAEQKKICNCPTWTVFLRAFSHTLLLL